MGGEDNLGGERLCMYNIRTNKFPNDKESS